MITLKSLTRTVALAAVAFAAAPSSALAGSPFAALVGTWGGKVTAPLEGGKSERLSCKGYYSGKGSKTLRLNITCANPSTKVELRSVLDYSNGSVSGTWEERNYNQSVAPRWIFWYGGERCSRFCCKLPQTRRPEDWLVSRPEGPRVGVLPEL